MSNPSFAKNVQPFLHQSSLWSLKVQPFPINIALPIPFVQPSYQYINIIPQCLLIYLQPVDMSIKLALFALAALTCTALQFCEGPPSLVPVFISQNQTRKIPLASYFQGYDLEYSSEDEEILNIVPPFQSKMEGSSQLPSGSKVIGLGIPSQQHQNRGIMVAQLAQKLIVNYATFSANSLPSIEDQKVFDLPQKAECHSAEAINEQLDIVVDCMTVQLSHYICIIRDGLQCAEFESLFDDESATYMSKVLNVRDEQFLVSAFLEESAEEEGYLMIYNLMGDLPEFNMIVDKRTLFLEELSIKGLSILYRGTASEYVQLANDDGQIVRFKYLKSNQIEDVATHRISGRPTFISTTSSGNTFIATQQGISEYLPTFAPINTYTLTEDVSITDIQASDSALVVATQNQLYTFARDQPSYRHLLKRELFLSGVQVMMVEGSENFFSMSSSRMRLVRVGEGFVLVSNVVDDVNVDVEAHSQELVCKASLRVKVREVTDIYRKSYSTFHFERSLSVDMTDQFGGAYLNYNFSISNPKLSYQFSQVKEMKIEGTETGAVSTIVAINSTHFYKAKAIYKFIYIDLCTIGATIQCSNIYNSTVFTGVVAMDGRVTPDGHLILAWAYNKNAFEVITPLSRTTVFTMQGYSYDGVVVGRQMIFLTQKEENIIRLYSDDSKVVTIDKSYFTQEQLQKLGGGFYPRGVYLHPSRDDLFFLKLPTSIALMSLGGPKVSIVDVWTVNDKYIAEDKWDVVIGRDTFLLIKPSFVGEFTMLPNSTALLLHSVNLDSEPVLPAQYSQKLNMAFIQTTDSKIRVIRLNQPKMNAEYMQLDSPNQYWKASQDLIYGGWGALYILNKAPILEVKAQDQNSLTESSPLEVEVNSKNQRTTINSALTVISYPTKISALSSNVEPIELPETAQKTLVDFDYRDYFNGSIERIEILCPYSTYHNMSILYPFTKVNAEVAAPRVEQLLAFSNQVIALGDNRISLISAENKLIASYEVETYSDCQKMALSGSYLFVYCVGAGKQELVVMSVPSLTKVNDYILPLHIHHAHSMKASGMNLVIFDDFTEQIFVFEVQPTSLSTVSVLSVFTFGVTGEMRSMDMFDDKIFVTLSNVGVGVITLSQMQARIIILLEDEKIQNSILDSNEFIKVKALKKDQILVLSSNSLHFLINIDDDGFSVSETYNRYGSMETVDFAEVSDKYAMFMYKQGSTEYITLHARSAGALNQFYYSEAVSHVPSALVGDMLYVAVDDSVRMYSVGGYKLELDYEQGGNFNSLKATAVNQFGNVTRKVGISFESSEGGGLKWYSVVIMVVIVAILVGVAFGLYLRQKARKKNEHTETLVTEEEDEQV